MYKYVEVFFKLVDRVSLQSSPVCLVEGRMLVSALDHGGVCLGTSLSRAQRPRSNVCVSSPCHPLLPEMVKTPCRPVHCDLGEGEKERGREICAHSHSPVPEKFGHSHIRVSFCLNPNNEGLQHKPIML